MIYPKSDSLSLFIDLAYHILNYKKKKKKKKKINKGQSLATNWFITSLLQLTT
jgi:hypothetical protein